MNEDSVVAYSMRMEEESAALRALLAKAAEALKPFAKAYPGNRYLARVLAEIREVTNERS